MANFKTKRPTAETMDESSDGQPTKKRARYKMHGDAATAAAAAAAAAADESGGRGGGRGGGTEPAFPSFKRLPAELRLTIWHHFHAMRTMPHFHPYRVRAYMGRTKAYKNEIKLVPMAELHTVTRASREMLRICRESRYEVLKRLPDALELVGGGILRFDARRDIIYLDIIDARVMERLVDARNLPAHEAPAFTAAIRHVGFEMMAVVPRWSRNSHLNLSPSLDLLLAFPNLESISMISIDDMCDEDTSYAHANRSYKGWRKLPGVDYEKPPAKGNVTTLGRHVCIYCALGKCDDLRDRIKGGDRALPLESDISAADQARLAKLDFYGMLPVREANQANPKLRIEEFSAVRVHEQ